MTDIKRLSLHGRLRMAAACPDPNAPLLAEAADAIEQHEAFRQEVSTEMLEYSKWCKSVGLQFPLLLERFIIAKPDPLVDLCYSMGLKVTGHELRAAIEKRGGKIVWGEG